MCLQTNFKEGTLSLSHAFLRWPLVPNNSLPADRALSGQKNEINSRLSRTSLSRCTAGRSAGPFRRAVPTNRLNPSRAHIDKASVN
ncbi:unnamed protein product [Protopolystoma xenopodis]|uniref:Uncharacterized protein n=1 Tax=Protopolystoma xenopodis TaxID=117903 RepID=A0A3S5AWC3_9PLAT|nr:unnamed protein product [Protopolystoma xenopodis]